VADLAGLLGREPAWDEVKQAFLSGLAAELGACFEPGALTPWETELAQSLMASRQSVSSS
jgi:hypothetical protein